MAGRRGQSRGVVGLMGMMEEEESWLSLKLIPALRS